MTKLLHKKFKEQCLSDPKVLAAYNELEEEFTLISKILRARKMTGKTQADVAKLMKTTPSVISRLESIDSKHKHSPSFETLKKYAHALGYKLSIKLVKRKQA